MKELRSQELFGSKLEQLRKARGLTQTQLGQMVGLSQRMIHHYESKIKKVPTSKLPQFAKALSVSVDELLGLKNVISKMNPKNVALWRRLRKVETLAKQDQKTILRMIDIASSKSNNHVQKYGGI